MCRNSKTAKMVLGRYYRVLNSRLALTRLAILNRPTWNENTKTEVTSRNNVEHQSVPTTRILQWMPMPMVERYVQTCLNFSLSFCLHVRALAWRHSDNDVSRPAAVYALPVTHQLQRWQRASNNKLQLYGYRPLLLRKNWNIFVILTFEFTVR